MNREDARKIAEALMPMLRKEIANAVRECMTDTTDEYLNTEEAARYICRSVSFLKVHPEIPHTYLGRRKLYTKASLQSYIRR